MISNAKPWRTMAFMSALDKRISLLKWVWLLASLNVVASFLVATYYGGIPDTKDGRFYINSHGTLREISHALYTYLRWYGRVTAVLLVSGIACAYWWLRLVKQRKDEQLQHLR